MTVGVLFLKTEGEKSSLYGMSHGCKLLQIIFVLHFFTGAGVDVLMLPGFA